ncbi:uncharacterized protein LOC131939266 [Physella acuta]|uniref:uncharacterized protein LOC131939266 n=1 Tax=Physella acuta TaxID=109671 RepID=UPI0027DC93D9|nr:uncharacterized protein LOC131939266 [Physella acuta]
MQGHYSSMSKMPFGSLYLTVMLLLVTIIPSSRSCKSKSGGAANPEKQEPTGPSCYVISYNSSCYLFGNKNMTFPEAYTFCQQHEGILSEFSYDSFLKDNNESVIQGVYWIGLLWVSTLDTWVWASGSTLSIPELHVENTTSPDSNCTTVQANGLDVFRTSCSEKYTPVCRLNTRNCNITTLAGLNCVGPTKESSSSTSSSSVDPIPEDPTIGIHEGPTIGIYDCGPNAPPNSTGTVRDKAKFVVSDECVNDKKCDGKHFILIICIASALGISVIANVALICKLCFRKGKHFFRDKSSFHSRSEPNVKTDSILVYSRCDNNDNSALPVFPATIQEKPEQDLYANDEDENRYSDIPGDVYSNTVSPNSEFPKTFKGLEINVSHLADEQRNKKPHLGVSLLEKEGKLNTSDNETYSHLNHNSTGNLSQRGYTENVYGDESVTELN